MPCHSELNTQLKGLQARLQQAEDDLNAHYAGISQLALSLAANPFTAGSAAATAAIYNLNPIGMKILRALLKALIPKELQNAMRMLTIMSASTIDSIGEGIVDSAAAQVIGAVNYGIDAITATAVGEMAAIQNELNMLIPNAVNGISNALVQSTLTNDRAYNVNLAQQAYDAWYAATIAPIGQFTQDQINTLRIAYLNAQQVVNSIDAGVAGVVAQAGGLLSGVAPTIQEINAALQQFNVVAAFILSQNDVSSCKSIAMTIGPNT